MNEFDEACNEAAKVRVSSYQCMLNHVLDSAKTPVTASDVLDVMKSLIEVEQKRISAYEYERDAKLDAMTDGE